MLISKKQYMPDKFTRRNDMDALRAIAMLLGIAFHVGLAYTGNGWFITDNNNHNFFAWLCDSSHGFRMPLFFVLSGFFTAMLWKKRGLKKLLIHRFKRIFLPCIAATFIFGGANILAIKYVMSDTKSNPGKVSLKVTEDITKMQQKIHGKKPWTLELKSHPEKALIFTDDFQFQPHGIGSNLALGEASDAAKVIFVDNVIRKADAPIKAFEVSFEKFTKENPVVAWYSNGNTKRAHKWQVNRNLSLSPQRGKHLVLGWDSQLKLVPHGDPRQLIFKNIPESALQIRDSQPAFLEKNDQGLLDKYYALLKTETFSGQVFGHMWFLWFLCWLIIFFAATALIWQKLKFTIPNKMIAMPWCFLWLIPLTYLPQSIMHLGANHFGPDTAIGLLPYPHTLFYYAIFFAFGALLFARDGAPPKNSIRGWGLFAVSLFILFPLWSPENSNKALMDLLQVSYTWIMIFAWIDLFRYYFSKESKAMRYISDASYWMYLAHMPMVFLGQHWISSWELNAFIKFTIANLVLFSILLASYHYLVRSTFIGTFLNGRRLPFFKKNKESTPNINENSTVVDSQ